MTFVVDSQVAVFLLLLIGVIFILFFLFSGVDLHIPKSIEGDWLDLLPAEIPQLYEAFSELAVEESWFCLVIWAPNFNKQLSNSKTLWPVEDALISYKMHNGKIVLKWHYVETPPVAEMLSLAMLFCQKLGCQPIYEKDEFFGTESFWVEEGDLFQLGMRLLTEFCGYGVDDEVYCQFEGFIGKRDINSLLHFEAIQAES